MSALEKFAGWGLHFAKPSDEQVILPADITTISSEQLGELFTRLTAWTDYIASQKVMAELEERAALKQKDFTENTMLIRRMGASVKGERITAVKAEVSIHPELVALENEYEEKYAYRKLVDMLLTNHERDLALVSREITRRTNDQRANRKDYGI
jgi:hypothetical protein